MYKLQKIQTYGNIRLT